MSTLLPTLLLLFAQEPTQDLQSLLAEAPGAAPAQVLRLADRSELLYEDGWQDAAAEMLPGAEPAGRLLIARLLTQAGDLRGEKALLDLLRAGDRAWQRAALATLSLGTFDADPEVQDGLVALLGDLIPEDDPAFYCEAAVALERIGDGARRRAALRYLQRTRESVDEETRRQGALALGRTAVLLETDTLDLLQEMADGYGADAALAASILEKQEQRERFRSKLAALERLYAQQDSGAADERLSPDDVRLIESILQMVERMHVEGDKFDREELLAAAADGLLNAIDPYSTYFTGEEYGEFWFDLNPEYGGIGAYVRTVDGVFSIVRPIYSGPAFEAGLMSDDKVLSVDGWPTADQPDDEIIKRLKGPPGTEVVVEIYRDGWTEARKFTLTRRKIELPVLQTEMLPDRVLYLELISFTVDSGRLIAAAVEQARQEGDLSGVVLDLRNNPGGSLEQAVAICDAFLDSGKLIVTTRTRFGEAERHVTRTPALVAEDIPLRVLINEYSASASEIVAGALSIHGRAQTIGERTHGKGSVQIMRPVRGLPDEPFVDGNGNRIKDEWEEYEDVNDNGEYDFGPKVKLTIAYYYLPDGSTIHTQRDHEGRIVEEGGVEPDLPVEFWRYEPIVLRELDRLIQDGAFRDYADQLIADDLQGAIGLAEYDARDVSRYPGWNEFYGSLETFLDADVVRQWVRRNLRASEAVSDARGRTFPGGGFRGDFEEDPQLGTAIREVLEARGKDAFAVPEYAASFEKTVAAETESAAEDDSQG